MSGWLKSLIVTVKSWFVPPAESQDERTRRIIGEIEGVIDTYIEPDTQQSDSYERVKRTDRAMKKLYRSVRSNWNADPEFRRKVMRTLFALSSLKYFRINSSDLLPGQSIEFKLKTINRLAEMGPDLLTRQDLEIAKIRLEQQWGRL